MKYFLIVLILSLTILSDSGAQIMDKVKTYDLEDIKPEDIPSEATLRLMGVPENQIEKAMLFKEGKKTKEELEREILELRNESKTDTPDVKKVIEEELPPPQIIPMSELMDKSDVFGKNFLRNRDIRIFKRNDLSKAPANYVLGPEDVVSISVWGYSEYEGEFTISQDGYINPSEIGRIYLKGVTFENAQSLIKQKFSGYLDLRNSQIAISLIYSRVITVNIVGEVVKPGSYSISAINSAFNALIAAGGPNEFGSVRKIFIKREGRTIQTLDVYEFLLNPDSREEYFLQNNDYIFIPRAERVVKIKGEILRPMAYELKDYENLNALINYSGGFKPTAITTSLQLQRFSDNELVIKDIAYDSLSRINSDFKLLDGDTIFVSRIPGILTNYVEALGAVKMPGKFEYYDGMRVSDLIEKAEGVLEQAYTQRAYLMRLNNDLTTRYMPVSLDDVLMKKPTATNLELQRFDKLKIFSKNEFTEMYTVKITGAVRKPGQFLYGQNMTLKDLLYFSGGLKPEAANNRIEISRIINYDESVTKGVPSKIVIEIIEIGKDLSIDFESENIKLLAFDHVYVRETPDFRTQRSITITGEVRYPGLYSLRSKDEQLTELIERSGGFTDEAFINGIKLYREEDNAGFVFVDYEKAIKKLNSRFNYTMEDGDEIIVPRLDELVKIKGEIKYPGIDTIKQINTPYEKGKRADHYIKTYGAGFEHTAKKKRTYVELASGYVRNTKNYGLFKVYPKVEAGSTIVVQPKRKKPRKERREREPRDPAQVNAIVASVSTSFTTLLTLYLVLRDLNR